MAQHPFIEDLQSDHQKLLAVLEEMKSMKPDSIEGQAKLKEFKTLIQSHLGKEDESLYPALEREAARDGELRNTLDVFARDIREISGFVGEFLQKHLTEASNEDWARDFGKLYATLKARVRKEENILYREYEKREGALK
jgi:iron-sulfur cluster repair protein YtfE (RIC family)